MAHKDLNKCVAVLEQLVGALTHDTGSLSKQGELHMVCMKELSQLALDNQKDVVARYNDFLSQLLKVAK